MFNSAISLKTSLLVLVVGGVIFSGCTVENATFHDAYAGRGYCDFLGCFQCDENESCQPLDNTSCSEQMDCQGGEICTEIGCANLCNSYQDCLDNESCINGLCTPLGFSKLTPKLHGCNNDIDCSSDQFCEQGTCYPRCKSDDQCGPEQFCAPCGKCQAKDVPAICGGNQNYCSAEVDCGSSKQCIEGRCHFQCTVSTQCPLGQICNEQICQDDPNPTAPECVLDLDCGLGACVNGYCHLACSSSLECDEGSLCLMGLCRPDYHPLP